MERRMFVVLVLVVSIVSGLVKFGGTLFAKSDPCASHVGLASRGFDLEMGPKLVADGPVCLPHEVCGPQRAVVGSIAMRTESGIDEDLANVAGMHVVKRLSVQLPKDGPVCLPHEQCGPGKLG